MPELPRTIIYPVSDLAAATALYRAVTGVEPYVESPYYVGFRVDGGELGLDPNGARQGLSGPAAYWVVDDVHAGIEALVAAGATLVKPPMDVGEGKLVAVVADADGNQTGLTNKP